MSNIPADKTLIGSVVFIIVGLYELYLGEFFGGILLTAVGIVVSNQVRKWIWEGIKLAYSLVTKEGREEVKTVMKESPGAVQTGKTKVGRDLIINVNQPTKGDIKKSSDLDETNLSILKYLNKEYMKHPHKWFSDTELTGNVSLPKEKLSATVKYLDGKGLIKVKWFIGGNFICQITSDGIDAVK